MPIGFTTLQLSACDDLLHNSPFCRARLLQQQCGYVNWRITLPDTAIVNILAHKSSSQSIIDLSSVIPRDYTSLLNNNKQSTAVIIRDRRRNKACLVVSTSLDLYQQPLWEILVRIVCFINIQKRGLQCLHSYHLKHDFLKWMYRSHRIDYDLNLTETRSVAYLSLSNWHSVKEVIESWYLNRDKFSFILTDRR